MRNFLMVLIVCILLTPPLFSQTQPDAAKPSGDVRFSVDLLDKSIDPCNDFYAYACSKWSAKNPIPSDRPSWGRFDELQQRGQFVVRDILEKAAVDRPGRSVNEQKIGDFYASCMDESAIEKAGTKPLQPDFDNIAAIKSKGDLTNEIIRLHREGTDVLFGFDSGSDFKNASQIIAQVDQGGLGMPDRDYYFKDDPKSVELRKKYVEHVTRMFVLLGDDESKAAAEAKVVMDIETGLAKGALDQTSRRDPQKTYHKMTDQELAVLSPSFNWTVYFEGVGAPHFDSLNVVEPDFIKNMQEVIGAHSLEEWKTYMRWHALHSNAAILPTAFVNENFNFFGKTMQGTKELRPRWKRCVSYANNDVGELIGQIYVQQTFGAEGKERTLAMVKALEKALGEDIKSLPWMGADTKAQALVKLQLITNRIGYPDKWRDYSSLQIVRGDALGNSKRANQSDLKYRLDKIGTPLDKRDWPYPPMTVNATYDPTQNNITFPAGILQPPFYDNQADDAMNFGGIGAVIGHELTHGFDDQGSQFDGDGNLRDWWTASDKKQFEERTDCIKNQYGNFVAVDDLKLNGKLTLGENTADNGGLRIAYMALLSTFAGKEPAPIDGLTAEQRFFLGWANVWCDNQTDAFTRMLATIDPHSPSRYRVNGSLSNMPEFREAYHCAATAPMVNQNACRVW
ncbi:MAG TPA: M13 family metallopeptidase [Terriglobales bacterium]|jgi:putative endopeptidase|nr:M13 family metallopeptidase [Terriglobales bacterium]